VNTSRLRLLIFAVILSGVLLSTMSWTDQKPKRFHTGEGLMAIKGGDDPYALPWGSNSMFTGSGRCGGCHGIDPNEYANITAKGWDVNPTELWRGTMMANAARDPFWRAKVSHEVAINPEHQVALEDKCTSCHAPLGHFAAYFDGAQSYSIADMLVDSLALDGVSCGACHQQDPDGLGDFFSGELTFQPDTIYGPYNAPDDSVSPPVFNQPMVSFVGYDPVYGEHIHKSELCAACHTLITSTVDLEGEFTGGSFVEQATYHEWLNSSFNNEVTGKECQGCHFPQLGEPVVVSSGYLFLQPREPFGLHYMVGGNTFMLELLKNNVEELGLTASPDHFQAVKDLTETQLQNATAEVIIDELNVDDDTAYYEVTIANLTGHKFPSGYPSRRAFLEFVVTGDSGDTLFQSGVLGDNYEVFGQNATYEPHYNMINDPEEVQIYEMVMGDVNGDVTTVLERADHPIKDNRLVPLGFSTAHFAYDTVAIAGLALDDADFNHLNGIEGSGTDAIRYHVPLAGYTGIMNVTAKLMYQPVPPKWNDEMFAVSTPEIEVFETMYWETGPFATLVDEDFWETVIVSVNENEHRSFEVFPNPATTERVSIFSPEQIQGARLYDARGSLVGNYNFKQGMNPLNLPKSTGTYYLVFNYHGQTISRKILKL
jgi:hypothetical protein